MPKEKYTREIIESAIIGSRSFRDLSIKIGAGSHGGAIDSITKKVKRFGLDTSHFTGKSWSRGFISNKKTPYSEILKIGSEQKTHKLKRSLLEIGRVLKCDMCGIDTWMGASIDLQIDHINGNKKDNREDNLRFLCPNCHSQTSTFCFKGRSHD